MKEKLRDIIAGLYWDTMMEPDEELAYLTRKIARMLEEPILIHQDVEIEKVRFIYVLIRTELEISETMEKDPRKIDIYQMAIAKLDILLERWEEKP